MYRSARFMALAFDNALLTYFPPTNLAVKRPFLLNYRATQLINFLLGWRQMATK